MEKLGVNRFLTTAENGNVAELRKMRTEDKILHLTGIEWKRICKLLDKGANPVVYELCNCLMVYIRSGIISPAEVYSIKKDLKPWIDDYVAKGDNRIRYYRIKELQGIIDAV